MSGDDDRQPCPETPEQVDRDNALPADAESLGASAPPGVRGGALRGLRQAGAAIIAHKTVLSWGAFVITSLICPVQRWYFIFRVNSPKDFVWSDMAGYVERAWRLSKAGVVLNRTDAFYPPGTHVLMAPLFRWAGSREGGILANQWLWWVFAVVTVWAVGLIGLKLFRHPLAGALAMIGLLVHWTFTAYTGFYSSENPFACLMAVSLLAGLMARDVAPHLRSRRVIAFGIAGLLAGLAATIRPQFLLSVAIIGLPLLRRRWPFARWPEAIALGLATVLPLAGAMALNSHAAGIPMGLSGNAGLNFYQAHCDVIHVEMRLGRNKAGFAAPVHIQRAQNAGLNPDRKVVIEGHMHWDSPYFFREGLKCIRADGLGHVRDLAASVADLFATTEPWPPNMGKLAKKTRRANELYCYGLIGLVPICLWIARRRRPERWLLLQLGTILPVALLFCGDPRYRVPYDMFGCLMVGGLVAMVLGARRDFRK
jgi:hypothetical protein